VICPLISDHLPQPRTRFGHRSSAPWRVGMHPHRTARHYGTSEGNNWAGLLARGARPPAPPADEAFHPTQTRACSRPNWKAQFERLGAQHLTCWPFPWPTTFPSTWRARTLLPGECLEGGQRFAAAGAGSVPIGFSTHCAHCP